MLQRLCVHFSNVAKESFVKDSFEVLPGGDAGECGLGEVEKAQDAAPEQNHQLILNIYNLVVNHPKHNNLNNFTHLLEDIVLAFFGGYL